MSMTSSRFRQFTLFPTLIVLVAAATIPLSHDRATHAAPSKKKQPLGLDGAKWIWKQAGSRTGEVNYFIKSFNVPAAAKSARVVGTGDNSFTAYINGKKVLSSTAWEQAVQADATKFVKKGTNIIAVQAGNEGAQAGFIMKLEVTGADNKTTVISTDKSWQVTDKITGQAKDTWKTGIISKGFAPAHVIGAYGVGPWAKKPTTGGGGSSFATLKTSAPIVKEGFKAERIYTVPKGEQGSWVSITFDHKGDLIASDQGNKGLYRVKLPKLDDPDGEVKVTKIPVNFSSAQGMVWAFDSLYANRNGGGLYRITDSNKDGELDKADHIMPLGGGGEHGPHAVIKTFDGKGLYVIGGNHTNKPDKLTGSKMPLNWSEDLLLPRQWDARGHARGRLAPGGWIARINPDATERELISNGFRNQYDIALNREGDLFAYDADMEWDFGSPWYRPTRVTHATSGSEFGWRSGTGKWPTYYEDSLPPAINIGPGSPVGVTFGYGTKFPAKYQDALYILDWTYGTIHAVHFTPNGSSYTATKEDFVYGNPLPVTDVAIGPDGAMYFTIGGRGSQSALYRVTYAGTNSTKPSKPFINNKLWQLRNTRRTLEAFHGKKDSKAVATAWPYLGHEDRFIRFAARIAIENQPVSQWQEKALSGKGSRSAWEAVNSAIALARQGDKSLQPKILNMLWNYPVDAFPADEQLGLLRAYALTFTRMGKPDSEAAQKIAKRLEKSYPSTDNRVNRELCRVLCYLDSPTVVAKTLKLMETAEPTPNPEWATLAARNGRYGGAVMRMLGNMPNQQNIHYAYCLRNVRYGWSLEQRRAYFKWFTVAAKTTGGNSFQGFLSNIRKEALANCSSGERAAVADITGEKLVVQPIPSDLPAPKGPGHKWNYDEVLKLVGTGLRKRNFENGQRTFNAAKCILCHRFDGSGGSIGPDLTGVVSRFSYRDLMENIIEPSKVISDQYESEILRTLDGVVTGRVVGEDEETLTVLTDAYKPSKLTVIKKADVDDRRKAKSSIMPSELLNTLNKDEVLDLLAYMMSRGNKDDKVFR